MSASALADLGYTSSTSYQREQAEKAGENSGQVSYQSFLKLLTTQLANQDPMNPMEDIDFTGQLAQLQALDEQMEMTKALKAMRTDTQLQAGTAMIGKYVQGIDESGNEATGLVERVVQNSKGVFVELAGDVTRRIDVGSINNVWDDPNDMSRDIIGSGNAIGKWVEAGVNPETKEPIRGIVKTVKMQGGQVVIELYGGEEVTWDQITELRPPTTAEEIYVYPAAIRERILEAIKMPDSGITGKNADGETVNGIVMPAYNVVDGKVFVYLYNPDDPENPIAVNVDSITSGPRKPNASDARNSLTGFWVTGLDTAGNDLSGIVVGAEDNEDGMALILDSGERLYFDAVKELRLAEGAEQARMHGMFIEGAGTDGEAAGGVAIEKILLDGKLGFRLHTGAIVLCENITNVRDATDDEARAAQEIEDALNGEEGE